MATGTAGYKTLVQLGSRIKRVLRLRAYPYSTCGELDKDRPYFDVPLRRNTFWVISKSACFKLKAFRLSLGGHEIPMKSLCALTRVGVQYSIRFKVACTVHTTL